MRRHNAISEAEKSNIAGGMRLVRPLIAPGVLLGVALDKY